MCATSFEASESGVLTAEQESIDKCSPQFSGVVKVIDLILSEEEAGGCSSKADSEGFVESWEQEFGARQQCGGLADQVLTFGFVAIHAVGVLPVGHAGVEWIEIERFPWSVAGFRVLETGDGLRVHLYAALWMVDFGRCFGLFLQATGCAAKGVVCDGADAVNSGHTGTGIDWVSPSGGSS